MLYTTFKFVSSKHSRNKQSNNVMVGSGRVGPCRLITDMGSIHEKNFFCLMDYVPKINTKRDMRCCQFPNVTAEGGYRLRATLCFAQRRSH